MDGPPPRVTGLPRIAVVFNSTQEAEFCRPPLTASRQLVTEMARRAVDSVLSPDRTPTSVVLPMKLVVRESCGCPAF